MTTEPLDCVQQPDNGHFSHIVDDTASLHLSKHKTQSVETSAAWQLHKIHLIAGLGKQGTPAATHRLW